MRVSGFFVCSKNRIAIVGAARISVAAFTADIGHKEESL